MTNISIIPCLSVGLLDFCFLMESVREPRVCLLCYRRTLLCFSVCTRTAARNGSEPRSNWVWKVASMGMERIPKWKACLYWTVLFSATNLSREKWTGILHVVFMQCFLRTFWQTLFVVQLLNACSLFSRSGHSCSDHRLKDSVGHYNLVVFLLFLLGAVYPHWLAEVRKFMHMLYWGWKYPQ